MMKKNNLLNSAIILLKGLQAFYVLTFILLTVLCVHVQIDRDFYADKPIIIENTKIHFDFSEHNIPNNSRLTLDMMSTKFLYISFFRMACPLLLLFLSIREFERVIRSVRNLSTFRNANVKSFRRIGMYALIYFFIDGFTFYGYGGLISTSFSPTLTPLMMALFAFIMAEIFKEGSLLIEDKELTI